MDSSTAQINAFALPQTFEKAQLAKAWWAVVSRFLLHGLIVSTWVSRIPAIQESLKLSNVQLGLCLLGTAIGSVASVAVTGWLIARFGSKEITTWTTAGFCIALVAPSLASNAITLFLALTIYGAMAGANDVSINSQAVAVETASGTHSMSRFHAMFSIGGFIGATLGGWAAAHTFEPAIHLAVASSLFVMLSACTAPYLLETHEHAESPSAKQPLTRLPALIVTLAILGFCLFLSEGAMADWTGVYLKQVLRAGSGTAAIGYAVFSLGMATFRLIGDFVTKLLGPVLTVRTAALMAAAGLTLALATSSIAWALLGFALTGAGCSVIVPLTFGAGGRVKGLPAGVGIAVVSGAGYVGFLFGPPLIGCIAQFTSLRVALFLLVALALLAVALAKAVGQRD
jgi:MFS family permease